MSSHFLHVTATHLPSTLGCSARLQVGTTFDDIGALDAVKASLREVIPYPTLIVLCKIPNIPISPNILGKDGF